MDFWFPRGAESILFLSPLPPASQSNPSSHPILHLGSLSPILSLHHCQGILPKCQGSQRHPIAFRTKSQLLSNTLARPQGSWHYASLIPCHFCSAPAVLPSFLTPAQLSLPFRPPQILLPLLLAPCCPSKPANVNSSIGWQLRVNSSKGFCFSWARGFAVDPTVLGMSPLLAPDTLH